MCVRGVGFFVGWLEFAVFFPVALRMCARDVLGWGWDWWDGGWTRKPRGVQVLLAFEEAADETGQ